jgi:hypothetical protein
VLCGGLGRGATAPFAIRRNVCPSGCFEHDSGVHRFEGAINVLRELPIGAIFKG